MEDENYMKHFEMIASAGMSKSNSMEAIQEARAGNFEQAEQLLEEANRNLTEAHKIHYQMLQDEANGKVIDVNIVAVHAQDHLTMATIMHDLGVEILNIYRILKKNEDSITL